MELSYQRWIDQLVEKSEEDKKFILYVIPHLFAIEREEMASSPWYQESYIQSKSCYLNGLLQVS